jgi:G3E family GTPase
MRAIAITGFLGSGKTTLTLALAEMLSERGERVAIIENERGGIGVDGAYLEAHGLTVREIRGGCICCELALPLVQTIAALRDGFQPDWLILEASGVANADSLRVSLAEPQVADVRWAFLALLDASRFRRLWGEQYGLSTLIRPQVAQADVLALSKLDLLSEDVMLDVAEEVQSLRPEIPLLPFAPGDDACVAEIVAAFGRFYVERLGVERFGG